MERVAVAASSLDQLDGAQSVRVGVFAGVVWVLLFLDAVYCVCGFGWNDCELCFVFAVFVNCPDGFLFIDIACDCHLCELSLYPFVNHSANNMFSWFT